MSETVPGHADLAETAGPYEARLCKDIPTDCCDYGVISLSEGREVCRVWREQDARAIAYALSTPIAAHGAGAVTEADYRHAAEFAAKMCWRTDPPNANNKLTDDERLSAIKYHPTIKELGRPHNNLALSEAALRPDEAADDPDEAYELGKRDGYEKAIQDLDVATGGDGEFRGSTFPGETVDVPVMRQRIIDRCQRLRHGNL